MRTFFVFAGVAPRLGVDLKKPMNSPCRDMGRWPDPGSSPGDWRLIFIAERSDFWDEGRSLFAPTGRAANRITETTEHEAKTIAALLAVTRRRPDQL